MSKRGRFDDEDGDYAAYGFSEEDEEEDELFLDPSLIVSTASHNPDAFAFDEEEDDDPAMPFPSLHGAVKNKLKNPITAPPHAAKFEVQPFVPVRSDKHAMDSVCFFSQGALITLLYANVTQGVPVPGLFDEENQCL